MRGLEHQYKTQQEQSSSSLPVVSVVSVREVPSKHKYCHPYLKHVYPYTFSALFFLLLFFSFSLE